MRVSSRKFKKFLVYLSILLFPLFFIFAVSSGVTPLKFSLTEIVLLPAKGFIWLGNELKKAGNYHHTYDRYQNLKKEVGNLRSRLIGQEEILRENNRYKRLLGFKSNLVFSSVAAHVIGRDPSRWSTAVIIDRGENDGLKIGMPVISDDGVVGKIAEVAGKKAKVILVNDPDFSVAALVARNREGGLVSGTLKGVCRLRYLAESASLEVGDRVITSKLSSSFPEGLLIGKVIALEGGEDFSNEWLIEPAVVLSQIEEVLVIQK